MYSCCFCFPLQWKTCIVFSLFLLNVLVNVKLNAKMTLLYQITKYYQFTFNPNSYIKWFWSYNLHFWRFELIYYEKEKDQMFLIVICVDVYYVKKSYFPGRVTSEKNNFIWFSGKRKEKIKKHWKSSRSKELRGLKHFFDKNS